MAIPAEVGESASGGTPTHIITDVGVRRGHRKREALGINARGDVVGFSYSREWADPVDPFSIIWDDRAFLFADGTRIDLCDLADRMTHAEALNNHNHVGGRSLWPHGHR